MYNTSLEITYVLVHNIRRKNIEALQIGDRQGVPFSVVLVAKENLEDCAYIAGAGIRDLFVRSLASSDLSFSLSDSRRMYICMNT